MNPDTMVSKVNDYLAYRRKAGYALRIAGRQLLNFAHFADQRKYRGPLTISLVSCWALANSTGKTRTAARRIEVIRPFAQYCKILDPKTEIPPRKLFGKGHRRLTPHIYTEQEILKLMSTAAKLLPANGMRPITCATIFGLLSATGMRISEATALRRQDVDLANGLLYIRHSKFGKSRLVPLHSSVINALKRYEKRRDKDPCSSGTDYFFIFDHGRPANTRNVQYAFNLICRKLRWLSRGEYRAPRIHDLRHSFVCRHLRRWYEEGVDIDSNMLSLSTYIGHVKVTDTYWYLTATPELMAIAAKRLKPLVASGGGL